MSSNNTGTLSSDQQNNNELYNDLDRSTQEEYQVCIFNLEKDILIFIHYPDPFT